MRAGEPGFAFGEVAVDVVPEFAGVGVAPCLALSAAGCEGGRELLYLWREGLGVEVAAVGELFGAADEEPDETVGESVRRFGGRQVPAELFAR